MRLKLRSLKEYLFILAKRASKLLRTVFDVSKAFVLRHQIWFLSLVFAAVLSVIAQLFFLNGKSGFNDEISGLDVSYKSTQQIAQDLSKHLGSASATVKTKTKEYQVSYDEIGVHADIPALTQKAVYYPLWQKLIPFSISARIVPREINAKPQIDDEKLALFASKLAQEDKQEAQDASIAFNSEEVSIKPAQTGYMYDATVLREFFESHSIVPGAMLYIEPKIIEPSVNDKEAEAVLEQARKALAKPPKIIAENLSVELDSQKVAGLLTASKSDQQQLVLQVNQTKLTELLNDINQKVSVASTPAIITLLDGGEVARLSGKEGRGIDLSSSLEVITRGILEGTGQTVSLNMVPIKPATSFNRTYTATQKGLQVLLNDLVAEKGDYAISVFEISGGSRVASSRGSVRYVAASTYKLYLAYYVLRQVEIGALAWGEVLQNGKTVDQCFEAMIVKSDNPCSEILIAKFGSANINSALRDIGINSSGVGGSGSYTTADDLSKFLAKLAHGSLVNESSKQKLLSAMQRQIYREGVPAGATNSAVANKVGFLYGYLNDAAIVYGPYSTYAVTILSNGSSWGQVADTAKRIHQLLN